MACLKYLYLAIGIVVLAAVGSFVLPSQFLNPSTVPGSPPVGGLSPVDARIYHEGDLILQAHFIVDGDVRKNPEKEWEMFLNRQRDVSCAFSPTTFFKEKQLVEVTGTDSWQLSQPKQGTLVRFTDGKTDTFNYDPSTEIRLSGGTIVLLSRLDLRLQPEGWVLDADKLVQDSHRYILVRQSNGADK